MAGKDIPAAGAALTANGTAEGTLTVASTAGFRKGSVANVSSSLVASVAVVVVEVVSSTVLKVVAQRTLAALGQQNNYKLNGISYGTSSMAVFLLADGAKIDAPQQFIYNEPTDP